MPINQRRPDTPLAATPEPRFVQDTIKPKVMTREEVRAQQEKDKNKPNAQLEGLETGKACKRGEKKGSCSTGATMGGDSLKDVK